MKTGKKRILIVEDDPVMRLSMDRFLRGKGYAVSLCTDGGEGLRAVEQDEYDLVITDLKLPGKDGFAVLRRVREVSPKTGVIIMTGHAEIKSSVQAIKMGAFDYIAKPFSNDELLLTLDRFFEFRRLEDEVKHLRETLREKDVFEDIIGAGPAMKDVFDRISSVAGLDVPVLIQGESGTGKELVANAVCRLSSRKDRPFIKINCASIPEGLFESELFGHEKGAFTGASELRRGKFEFADGGTIFLDEIGDIPMPLQPKLLRVLEDNIVTRLGGNAPIKVDVRTLYATSRNLRESIAAGGFREDLFYRINVVTITIPPLRERREDIPLLVERFLSYFSGKFSKPGMTISREAYDALLSYNYPGNVRELKHAVERAVVLSPGVIEVKHLPDELSGVTGKITRMPDDLTLDEGIKNFERQKIVKALEVTGGKKLDAARKLGIGRKALWKKLKLYNLE
ncbi:MAG: sigma-54-dependent Fis family transcriptional regulator [Nitrospirae bacterium]|nr:sigma-54-dependent Fis family transcriptional regulator [Nitrospirota bacterium]